MEYEKGDFIPVEVKHVNPKSNLKISNRVFMQTLRLCLSMTSVLHLCVCVLYEGVGGGSGTDILPRGGRVCEGERQGSLAVLLCFSITALSDLRMGTDSGTTGA